ncbi:MAG: VanZ family protein [Flavobacteriia bacterium]|jgi:VanZ family protein
MRIPRILVWVSAVIVFLVITILSVMPPKSGVEIPGNDKVGHFLAYFTFTVNCSMLTVNKKQQVSILPILILYGILIEFLQGCIPGRMPSGLDVLANSSGVFIGILAHLLIQNRVWLKVGPNN